MRHDRAPLALAATAIVVAAITGVLAAIRVGAGLVAVAGGLAVVLAGAALVSWGHRLSPPEPEIEERAQKGPDHARRRTYLGLGLGAAALTAVGVSVPAARRIDRMVDVLKGTRWREGALVVDSDGRPVVLDRIREGDVLTVYPEDAVGVIDSQAILVREPPERFSAEAERSGTVVAGVVIHSKLCTHMGCSMGLYQEGTGTLLCPCHQAAFDLLDRGEVVSGPARRPLPRLPFRRTADGLLVATGDFIGTVGAGFWWRP